MVASEADTADLIDVREAARVSGRTAETVRRWIWSGRLPARKVGRRLLISRARLEEEIGARQGVRLSLREWIDEMDAFRRQWPGPKRASSADIIFEERRRSGSKLAGR